jgi:hypothetical protein
MWITPGGSGKGICTSSMGVFNCPRHGRSGLQLACRHIVDQVRRREPLQAACEATYVDEELTSESVFDPSLIYCAECAESLNLPKIDSEIPYERFNDHYSSDGFPPSCRTCIKELTVI